MWLCSSLATCACAVRKEAQAECARGGQTAHGLLGLGNVGKKKECRHDQKSHTPRKNGGPEANILCPENAIEAKS